MACFQGFVLPKTLADEPIENDDIDLEKLAEEDLSQEDIDRILCCKTDDNNEIADCDDIFPDLDENGREINMYEPPDPEKLEKVVENEKEAPKLTLEETINFLNIDVKEMNFDRVSLELQKINFNLQAGEGSEKEWKKWVKNNDYELLKSLTFCIEENFIENPSKILYPVVFLLAQLDPYKIYNKIIDSCTKSIIPILLQFPPDELGKEEDIKLRMLILADIFSNIEEYEKLKIETPEDIVCEFLEFFSFQSEEILNLTATAFILFTKYLSKDVFIKYVATHPYTTQLSEEIVKIVNNASGPALLSVLNFVQIIFSSKPDFFYTNDIFLIIEILIRRIEHGTDESWSFIPCLHTIDTILQWKDYPKSRHKSSEIVELLNIKLADCGNNQKVNDIIVSILTKHIDMLEL